MFGSQSIATPLETIAHIIQVALTPVFLLSGIATLLNVFSTRLARVADRVDQVTQAMDDADEDQLGSLTDELAHLNRRSVALDSAVILAALGGAATCAAVLTLFVGALRDSTVASILFFLFGLAVVCALGAIGAFTVEMLMTGIGVRARCAAGRRASTEGGPAPAALPPDAGVGQAANRSGTA
jgi:Protein of unknown function (DUF2721)